MRVIEGRLEAQGLRFALVVSRFNEALTTRLESGAVDCLLRHGAAGDDITVFRVPGAWEVPMAVARVVRDGGYDAVIGQITYGDQEVYWVYVMERKKQFRSKIVELFYTV